MNNIYRYDQLDAWQLANDLATLVERLVATGGAARNWSFRDQILKSSAKPPAQIAEGFARGRPAESAYYYRIARASVAETKNHLLRGLRRGYWKEDQYREADAIADRTMQTTGGLLASRLALIKKQKREREAARRAKKAQRRKPTRGAAARVAGVLRERNVVSERAPHGARTFGTD